MNDLDRQDERLSIYIRDRGRCQTCGESLAWGEFQLAHRIANTKANVKSYGRTIIDHPLNRRVTCPGRCNDAQNIGGRPVECDKLAHEIKEVSPSRRREHD